jgi:hypothetical protein
MRRILVLVSIHASRPTTTYFGHAADIEHWTLKVSSSRFNHNDEQNRINIEKFFLLRFLSFWLRSLQCLVFVPDVPNICRCAPTMTYLFGRALK